MCHKESYNNFKTILLVVIVLCILFPKKSNFRNVESQLSTGLISGGANLRMMGQVRDDPGFETTRHEPFTDIMFDSELEEYESDL